MLIDRADNTVSICEMKYVQDEFKMTAEDADKIRRRGAIFASVFRSHKSIQNALIANCGMKRTRHSGVIQSMVTLDDLFRDVK